MVLILHHTCFHCSNAMFVLLLICRVLLLMLCSTSRFVGSFNADTKTPLLKRGASGTYFGFSVAAHKVRSHDGTNRSHPVLLIGAPKDNITDPEASPVVRRITRPGVVYRCPLTFEPDDCSQLTIGSEDPRNNEDRTDQWMGATVVSQGTDDGNALACAPRYKRFGSSFVWGLGWCTSLKNSLEEDRFWEPCAGKPTFNGHGEYGFCQAGISAAISTEGEIALGAPGPYNWRGAVFANSLHDDFQTWHQSSVEDEKNSRGADGRQKKPATNYYSYLGMSVQIGDVIPGKRSYVAGAPRSSFAGQVLIFEMTPDDGLTTEPSLYLTGEQFGSGFGYSVAVADFNSDGRDDVAVGAPFFHHSSSTAIGGIVYVYGNSEQGIHSQTTPVRLFGRKAKEVECQEWRCHDARFGMAMAAIGDSDQDGYPDLAIGAPYEDRGAVYIFLGSSSGIGRTASQRVSASELPSFVRPLQSFGYSVSGGVDLDLNGYPDLVVGAFGSDAVVVLWMRSVVDVEATVANQPSLIDPRKGTCIFDRQPFTCFQLTVCFRFNRRFQTMAPRSHDIRIDFSLQAEKTSDAYSRIFFPPSLSSTSSPLPFSTSDAFTYNNSILLDGQNARRCSNVTVYLTQSNKDFLNPVRSVLTYRLSNQKILGKNKTDGKPFPPHLDEVLSNEDFASRIGIQHSVDFLKNCGENSKCEANLRVHGVLQLDKDEIGQYVLRAGQEQELTLYIRIANREEDAHEAMLTVLLPPFLKYRGVNTEGLQYCEPSEGAVHCAIGNPLQGDQEISFALRLDASKVDYSIYDFDIKLIVNTTSFEVDDEDNEDILKVKVILETEIFVKGSSDPAHVYYEGEVVGESATLFLDDIGPIVKHSYEVKNLGKSVSPSVGVGILWPHEVEMGYPHGKHLLYLTDAPQLEDEFTECFLDDKYINPLKLSNRRITNPALNNKSEEVESNKDRRFRRSSNPTPDGRPREILASRDSSVDATERIVHLDCDLRNTKCFTIYCKIKSIQPGNSVVISILSRIWRSTFVEDYRNIDHVRISSRAHLEIEFGENIRQLHQANSTDKATTIAFPDIGIQDVRKVPLWIIILSVVVGVLFLCLVVWILWKCGFFLRERGVNMQHRAVVEKPDYHYNLLQHSTVTMTRRHDL